MQPSLHFSSPHGPFLILLIDGSKEMKNRQLKETNLTFVNTVIVTPMEESFFRWILQWIFLLYTSSSRRKASCIEFYTGILCCYTPRSKAFCVGFYIGIVCVCVSYSLYLCGNGAGLMSIFTVSSEQCTTYLCYSLRL